MELFDSDSEGESKEEPRADEDYDPIMFEEMKERAEPRPRAIPDLTITLTSLSQYTKPSKMLADANEAEGMLDYETIEADLVSQMSEEVVDKSYAYGLVGIRMQKRLPLR